MRMIIKLLLICIPIIVIILLGVSAFLIEKNVGNVNERIYTDENGIPYYDFQSISGEYIGKQRNPIIIFRVANNFYNDFVKNDNETSKKLFMNNVNWLLENTIKHENYSIFEHSFNYPIYDLPIGWHDAMAQGRIITIMLKAHNLTNDERYLNEAKLLSNAFFVDVLDGGLTYKTKDNGWWYEHRAHKDGLNPRILNGMMFTLLDIYYLYEYTNDTDAKFLFDQGIISLKNDIPNYDFFGYTYHDALKNPTTYNYQKIHVQQTKLLYDITHEKIFIDYHNKWKSCEEICHFILKKIDQWFLGSFRNQNNYDFVYS